MSTHQNILGHTLDQLGEAIVSGRYAPGSAIPPEPVLGEAFGVSRTVVREAIKSLVAKGLVVTGPKVGTRVLPAEQWNWFDQSVVRWPMRSARCCARASSCPRPSRTARRSRCRCTAPCWMPSSTTTPTAPSGRRWC